MLCDNPGQGVDLLRPLGRINSQHLAASPAGESHAGQNLYSGCLSRPIGAQEAKDLPRIQPQGDAFQRPLATGIVFESLSKRTASMSLFLQMFLQPPHQA